MDDEASARQRARQLLRESIQFRTSLLSEIHNEILAASQDGWAENNARLHLSRHIHLIPCKVHIDK